jgi:hypothetical protein
MVTFSVLGYTLSRIKAEKKLSIVTEASARQSWKPWLRPASLTQAGVDVAE